jgi:hypothetical protein
MKNIQTGILKILGAMLLVGAIDGHAQTPAELLQKADSLFIKKQFTQSFEIYQRVHNRGQYSPAMFLKMAFIQEGLNKPSLALYYLNLYYLASGDDQTLAKMEELAIKNSLYGYEYTQMVQARELITRYRLHAAAGIAAIIFLLMALAVYQTRRGTKPVAAVVFAMFGLVFLALFVNFSAPQRTAIITGNNTFVMNGPSAGASVVALLNEGHKVQIKDKKDVWLKVYWADQYVYVRQSQVQEVIL